MDLLTDTLKGIAPIDHEWIAQTEARQLQLTKPPGSLGRLEEIACRLARFKRLCNHGRRADALWSLLPIMALRPKA